MKNRIFISIILTSVILTHNTSQAFSFSAHTQTMLSNTHLQITPEKTFKACAIAAGTGTAIWLCHKAYTAYKNYSIKKHIQKKQYELLLDACLPSTPLPLATMGKQEQAPLFDGVETNDIIKLFNAICFDERQDVYAFNDATSFEAHVQKAYTRIETFKKHTFLKNPRMAALQALICSTYMNSLKTFALNRILERTQFVPTTTTTPGLYPSQYDPAYTAQFFRNNYITAVDCISTIIERFDSLPLYRTRTTTAVQTSIDDILQQVSAGTFERKGAYRNILTTLQDALKRSPLYQHEIEIRVKQQQIEAEKQTAHAIQCQATATAAAAATERQKVLAIQQQTAATERQNRTLEEQNRIARAQLPQMPLQTPEQVGRAAREHRYYTARR